MFSKVEENEVKNIVDNLLKVIESKNANVNNVLKKSFYFKGRKSDSIAKEIIKVFTDKDDKILDPFFGGGSFILSALESERFIHGIELDNYTFDVFKTLLTKLDSQKLEKQFQKVRNSCKKEIMNLYKTKCCGEDNFIKTLYFDPQDDEYFDPKSHRDIKNGKNVKLLFKCPKCNEKEKKFDSFDQLMVKRISNYDTTKFPKNKYIENSRINITASTGSNYYDRLFTKRNQYALLLLQQAISKLEDSNEKHFIQHALVTSLALSRIAMYGSSTDILYHVVSEKAQEKNVWSVFEEKFKAMKKFQKEYINYLLIDDSKNKCLKINNGDYYKTLKNSEKSYDLIYTDFPYTDQVPYIERNQFFRVWLENFVDYAKFKIDQQLLEDEIVVTNAPSRKLKQSYDYYIKDLDKMFCVFYEVLKNQKHLIITTKLAKKSYLKTFSNIINLARKNGFEYITKVNVATNDPTLRKQSAYLNTFMTEAIIVFKKLNENNRYWYEGNINYEYSAVKLIYETIIKSENKTISQSQAANLIKKDLLSNSIVLDNTRIEKLERVINENFMLEKGFVYIDNNNLYLDIEEQSTLFMKLYDLIPIYVKKLLDKNGKFVLEDFYLELLSSVFLGNPNNLNELISNDKYNNQIKSLISRYCNIQNGYYVQRVIDNTVNNKKVDISQFDGIEFEFLIEKLLKAEGYYNTYIQGGAGDRGIDIVASKTDSSGKIIRCFFQCKRWVGNVGSEPIQRLYAEGSFHNIDYSICITTSDFTEEGKSAIKRLNVEGWNGWKLQEKLNYYFPKQYFNRALGTN